MTQNATPAATPLPADAKPGPATRMDAVSDAISSTVASTRKTARDFSQKSVEFAQANPYKALAIAAGIGFVAGLILKRR